MSRSYSLGVKCASELVGTLTGIYFGDSVVANVLLPNAKGQTMGFGFLALGYGFAFFFPGVWFGHVSGYFNPAFAMADLVLGKIHFRDFIALSASELLGAFLGAVCVWIHWMPHFKTVPEPPVPASEELLRTRDALPANCMTISSYNTQTHGRQQLRKKEREAQAARAAALPTLAEDAEGEQAAAVDGDPQGEGVSTLQRAESLGVLEAAQEAAKDWFADILYYAVQPGKHRKQKAHMVPGTDVDETDASLRRLDSLTSSLLESPTRSDSRRVTNNADESDRGYMRMRRTESGDKQRRPHGSADASSPAPRPLMPSRSRAFAASRRWAGGDVEAGAAQGTGGGALETVDSNKYHHVNDVVAAYQEEHLQRQLQAAALAAACLVPGLAIQPAMSQLGRRTTVNPSAAGNAAAMDAAANAVVELHMAAAAASAAAEATAGAIGNPISSTAIPSRTATAAEHQTSQLALPPVQPPEPDVSTDAIVRCASEPAAAQPPIAAKLDSRSPFEAWCATPFPSLPTLTRVGHQWSAPAPGAAQSSAKVGSPAMSGNPIQTSRPATPKAPSSKAVPTAPLTPLEREWQRITALYSAAMVADQNAKLSVFTTRPAICTPPFNWLCEFMCTVVLVCGILLTGKTLPDQEGSGAALMSFYNGLYITTLLLGLGGPTGLSVNPARDLGPRIAHAVLPIPNKGPSEWWYGWIPVTAALAGGAAGAGMFQAFSKMIDSYELVQASG